MRQAGRERGDRQAGGGGGPRAGRPSRRRAAMSTVGSSVLTGAGRVGFGPTLAPSGRRETSPQRGQAGDEDEENGSANGHRRQPAGGRVLRAKRAPGRGRHPRPAAADAQRERAALFAGGRRVALAGVASSSRRPMSAAQARAAVASMRR